MSLEAEERANAAPGPDRGLLADSLPSQFVGTSVLYLEMRSLLQYTVDLVWLRDEELLFSCRGLNGSLPKIYPHPNPENP